MESNYEKEMNKRNEKIPYEKEMNKRNEKIPYEKEMNKRNEKIPDPQNCFGGAAINQYPQIVLGGGGGREGGTPTLISIQHYLFTPHVPGFVFVNMSPNLLWLVQE